MQKRGSKSLNKTLGGRRRVGGLLKPDFTSAAAPAWSPSDKSGGLFWFDASDATTITKDGSNRVSAWTDKFGNASRNASQGTDANKPVWTAASLNGLPGLAFTSSSSQRMDFGSDSLVASGSPFSLAMVVKNTAGTSTWYQSVIGVKTATANSSLVLFFTNDASYQNLNINFITSPGSAGVRAATDFSSAAAGVLNYNGGTKSSTSSWTFHKNNSSETLSTSGNGTGSGSTNRIGSVGNTGASLFFNGLIYEIIAWDSVLSAGEMTSVEDYFSDKWGI